MVKEDLKNQKLYCDDCVTKRGLSYRSQFMTYYKDRCSFCRKRTYIVPASSLKREYPIPNNEYLNNTASGNTSVIGDKS